MLGVRHMAVLVAVALVNCEGFNATEDDRRQCPNAKVPLSLIRKRRYLAFSKGSNFVLTISLVKAFMTHAPSGWNIALEIDVMYPLPDEAETAKLYRKKLRHRQKREFWEKLQNAFDYHNMNGRACVLRSACEADTLLAPPGVSLVHDLLRAVFSAPLHDKEFMEEMFVNYEELFEEGFCSKKNDCPVSLLQFVLALNKQS